ncbi:unnamed protein product [Oncorhynchus mykiss]|uniref:Iroquois-class homeodomain protein domain-containing protein n=1 Tax=Oncorhynchus mykiss TaxID=8022 RepID=A0A060YQH2_ONCMY|nr:unnamed protein product [Oncorhynchus mykiss]
MSFPQLGYQYIRPIYPPERQGISNARAGTELSPSGALSNVLSTMYGSPFAAAAQGYGAFLPYSNDISIFNQLGAQYELKDSPGVQGHPGFAHHHPAFYPYGQYQFGDPSRPKNATRESTSTLKAWLSEHPTTPDNPRKSPQMNGSNTVGPAAQTIISPHHRLISCPVGKIQNWTNRAFSAHQLALLNSNHYLGLANQASANGLALYSRQQHQHTQDKSHSSDTAVTERSSALEAEKKLLKTAFHPVHRRPQNQLEAAMVLSALASS